jgi:hypothetical protein
MGEGRAVQEQLPKDAAVERTGMYSQGESPSGETRSSGREGALGYKVNCAARQGESPTGERRSSGGEGALGYSVSRKLSTNFCTP